MQNLIHYGKYFDEINARPTPAAAHQMASQLTETTGHTMKNFSTAALFLALASVVLPAQSQSSGRCTFLPNAPDQHVVVRGDTLWDISGRFLEQPWCWPQVWNLNRGQIRNPHWIYPGQVVYFDRTTGRLSLSRNNGAAGTDAPGTVRLSPEIRTSALGPDAISSISLSEIGPFLSQPLIVDADELTTSPRIIAAQEERVVIGNGDIAYVRGALGDKTEFHVFRAGKPLKDPGTQKIIGYEAAYLGAANLKRAGTTDEQPHTIIITKSKEEMGIGDRLLPVEPTSFLNFVPHAPEQRVDAQIVSVYNGVTHAGQNQIVTINRGKKDGLDIGSVLQLQRLGKTIVDRTSGHKETVKLPDEQYGNLFIFRVFNNISYGLVMQVRDTVQIGDIASSPE